jgi:hypothetical protein
VHKNRMLQRIHTEGLVTIAAKHITIHDIAGLQKVAGSVPILCTSTAGTDRGTKRLLSPSFSAPSRSR